MDFSISRTEILGIFGIMANTCGLHLLVHCGMASEVMEKVFLSFFISSNYVDIIGRTFYPMVAASKVNGSVVTA